MAKSKLRCGPIIVLLLINLWVTSMTEALARQNQSDKPRVPKIVMASQFMQDSAIKRKDPEYPPLAKQQAIDGPVVVEVTLDEGGNVIASRAVFGHPLLTEAAVKASREWKWNPTLLRGEPVKVIGSVVFNFDLGSSGLSQQEMEYYKKQISANPKSAEAYYKLGGVYARLLRHAEAIKSYKKAVSLNPGFAEAHHSLAVVYRRERRMEEAIEAYKKAINAKPDFAETYYELGDTYFSLNNTKKAIEYVEQSAKVNPQSAEAYKLLGMLYNLANRELEAIAALKRALEIKADWAEAHYSLGHIYANRGDKEAALKEKEILDRLDPKLAKALLSFIK